ncbi:MAG: sugar transferase [Lachnospiraceae bacterium]|nr:sugar transferase [Lachnospiraceae bacterium]
MYRKTNSTWLKHIDFTIIDIICLEFSFVIAYMIRHGMISPFERPLYVEMAVSLLLIDLVVVVFNASYKNILKRGYYKELIAVVMHMTLVALFSSVFLFFIQRGEEYSRMTFILMWIIGIVVDYVIRQSWKIHLRKRLYQSKRDKRSLLVVTTSEHAAEIIQDIKNNNFDEFTITGVCIEDRDMEGKIIRTIPVVANSDTVLEYICRSWVDEVFIDLPRDRAVVALLEKDCIEMGVTVHSKLAKALDMEGKKQVIEKIAGYTVLSSSINMATPGQLFLKRLIDIAGGLVGVFFTGILTIFLAPAIYIKSPGPIFFSQWRVGKNGRKFKIYKFRSMYMDAEERKKELMAQNKVQSDLMFKMENDPRIIGGENGKGIGNFIRNTSLDEFPQFFNVLKGEMSLVGTRPPTVDEWEKYELSHRKRLAIKPGITGMWQVSGRSDITDFDDVVGLDTEYIMNWSLTMDFKILAKTVAVVFKREGSA